MVAQRRCAPREDQCGFDAPLGRSDDAVEHGALAFFRHGHRDRGDAMRARIGGPDLEGAKVIADPCLQRLVARHGVTDSARHQPDATIAPP